MVMVEERAVIIVDEILTDFRGLDLWAESEGVRLLRCEILSKDLETQFSGYDGDKMALVFPGNGAGQVRKYLSFCKNFPCLDVFAKRIWHPGSDPVVTVGEILTKNFLSLDITKIIVVDDVISSGKTLSEIYRRNAWKFPKAKWSAAVWVMRTEAKINNYREIFASTVIASPAGRKIPINSLSTLLENKDIAESFVKRNFQEPERLVEILDKMRLE